MRSLRAFLTLCFATALCGSVLAAPAPRGSGTVAARVPGVADHVPQIDGPITTLTGPAGRAVAAWSYRAAGEFDIAVSLLEPGATTWSAPVFFGRRSGIDEVEPAIAFDAQGTAYVVFSLSNPSRVALSRLPAGATVWSTPTVVSGAQAASAPSVLVVGDHLIVAFRTAHGVGMVDVPTVVNQVDGLGDGPDPLNPMFLPKGLPVQSASTSVVPPPDPDPNP
jgi:hypothetical protein